MAGPKQGIFGPLRKPFRWLDAERGQNVSLRKGNPLMRNWRRIMTSCVVLALGWISQSQLQAQVGVIRGEVVDEQGNPIEDVTIRIEGMDVARKYKVDTGKDGKYLHAGVALQGVYRVIAEKKGFQSDYVEGVRPAFSTSDEERGVVNFRLKAGEARKLAFEMTDEEREELKRRQEEARKQAERMAAIREQFNMGVEQYNAGMFEEAAKSFAAALEKDPQQPAVWANLGNAYIKLNQYDKALEAYDKAIELSPQDPAFYQNRGSIHAALGNSEQAKADYEKSATISAADNPKAAAANFYNLGVTYINTGKNLEAAEALQKAIEYDPRHAEAHYQLGITLLGLNRIEDSLKHLKEYVKLAPQGPNAEVAAALIEQLGSQ